ncbi:MAG: PKD domain-containing protein, partial [Bacteroidota bacterium]
AVVDSVQIIYTEGIIANAGADQTVCEGSENTILNGLITNGSTTGIWSSSGTGVFDDPTNLGATYTFSSADSLAGTVVLTLESTNVGDCDVVTDDITISFGTNPTVDAGTDYEICGQDSIVALNGFISGGIGGEWSTSGSGNFGDETVMSTIYTLSPDDIVNGYIELTLTSEASGNCQPAADVTTINIDPIPVVFAGEDVVICTVDSVNLNAVVAYAPNVTWTTNGTGEFLVDSALTSVYIPSIADSLAGSIEVYATSFGTNVCDNVTDTMSIFVGGGALPDAGIDQFVCADGQNILLNGTIVGGGAVSWSTTGSGTFTPSNDELIVEYIPSSTDLLVGSVNLILETISGLGCEGGVDTTFIEFDPIPAITPMTDMSICESIDTVMVNGLIENADSIHWSTLGSGNFVLNNLTDVEYLPSEGDLTNGSVELIVEAFSETMCAAPNDTVTIFFSADLTADFVASNICAGQEAEFTDQTVVMNGNAIGWSWDFGDGQTENNQNPEHVYLDPGDYLVSLTVFNSTGCFDDAEQTITVEEGPTSDFEMDAEANVGDLVNTVDLSDDAASWAWDFGDGSSLNTNQNASHTYSQAGDYWVVLEVTNSLGCSDTTGALVRIGGDFVFPPNLPNAFSPNGDGENDQFFVRGGPFTEMHFIVYNGWGQEIFESQSPNEGWDGTHKGKDEPVGVYVYTVKATTVEGESFVKSGKVSLIR